MAGVGFQMADCLGVCRGRKVFLLALVVCLAPCTTDGVFAAVAQAEASPALPDCAGDYGQPGTPAVVPIQGNCTWSTLHQGSKVVIRSSRTSLGLHSNESATPAIFAATAAAPGNSAASTGGHRSSPGAGPSHAWCYTLADDQVSVQQKQLQQVQRHMTCCGLCCGQQCSLPA